MKMLGKKDYPYNSLLDRRKKPSSPLTTLTDKIDP
jgi:hypothetical protein